MDSGFKHYLLDGLGSVPQPSNSHVGNSFVQDVKCLFYKQEGLTSISPLKPCLLLLTNNFIGLQEMETGGLLQSDDLLDW